ncbi:hypothetical protein Adt_23308 [Abeliophyllum distichum]|uniref:Uncharacterized protein n=1 Tax=Abeliophyllum distichum TaxID=126358 RepID=A0ABD1SBL6_9LAMI
MAKVELASAKASMAEMETGAVRLYKKKFATTPEYSCFTDHFMEARGDQLMERIQMVHPEWDLSFSVGCPCRIPEDGRGFYFSDRLCSSGRRGSHFRLCCRRHFLCRPQ